MPTTTTTTITTNQPQYCTRLLRLQAWGPQATPYDLLATAEDTQLHGCRASHIAILSCLGAFCSKLASLLFTSCTPEAVSGIPFLHLPQLLICNVKHRTTMKASPSSCWCAYDPVQFEYLNDVPVSRCPRLPRAYSKRYVVNVTYWWTVPFFMLQVLPTIIIQLPEQLCCELVIKNIKNPDSDLLNNNYSKQ